MTNVAQAKPNPLPAILVYGTPSGPALTQASWLWSGVQKSAT